MKYSYLQSGSALSIDDIMPKDTCVNFLFYKRFKLIICFKLGWNKVNIVDLPIVVAIIKNLLLEDQSVTKTGDVLYNTCLGNQEMAL